MNTIIKFTMFIFLLFLTSVCHGYEDINISRVVRVYDGDTIYVDIDCYPSIIGSGVGIRVRGIDTPEMRGGTKESKWAALKAKHRVIELLENGEDIVLKNVSRGKYFRIVADVYIDGINMSDYLIREGLAVPYFGGTKK